MQRLVINSIEPVGKICFCRIKPSGKRQESIEFIRHHHGELGNLHLEFFTVEYFFHEVGAQHFANARSEVASAYVLMCFAGFQNWLLAHYTFAFYFPHLDVEVVDVPVAAQKLYGIVSAVLYGNLVSKQRNTFKQNIV